MAYRKPIAKNNTYFTRDLTEGNYKNGLYLLGIFWRNSVMSKPPYYPITNFDGLIDFYRVNYPTFIEYLGSLINSLGSDKASKIMLEVAGKGRTNYPRPSEFSNVLVSLYGKVDTIQVLGNAASDVGDAIVSFSKWYVYLLVFAGVLYGVYVLNSMGVFKKLKA